MAAEDRHRKPHPPSLRHSGVVLADAAGTAHLNPTEKVRGLMNSEVVFCAPGVLSATPLMYFLRRDDSDFVVFCFSKPEDTEAFAERFGRKRLPTSS